MSNREYKSDAFSMLMEDKRYALDVYNVLNESDYSDPDEVEIVLLEKGVSLSIRNDASFIIDMNFSFYEHQSTYNPNMPLRSLIYCVNALEEWLKKQEVDLFSSRRIKIPTPHFVVFYNGIKNRPEYEEMYLSEAFYHATDMPELEVRCRVYNINPPYNQALVKGSKVLAGYTYFVERVRDRQAHGATTEEAVDQAIRDCIEEHVLEAFFSERGDEIRKMTHLDFTWEKREKLIRKEEFAEGMACGMEQGMARGMAQGIASSVIKVLSELGSVSGEVSERILSEKDETTLYQWLTLAAKCQSIEEFEQKMD